MAEHASETITNLVWAFNEVAHKMNTSQKVYNKQSQ